jgi:tricorn protease-like protein
MKMIQKTLRIAVAFITALAMGLWPTAMPVQADALAQPSIFFTRNVLDSGGENQGNQIWVMNADGSSQRPVTGVGNISQPSLSPDGTRLAYMTNAGLVVSRLATGATTVLVPLDPAGNHNPSSPTWSPDSTQIAYSAGYNIYRVPSTGGTSVLVTTAGYNLAWSPDSSWLAFNSIVDGATQVLVVHPDGTGRTQLTSGFSYHGAPHWSPDSTKLVYSSSQPWILYFYDLAAQQQSQVAFLPTGSDAQKPIWTDDPNVIVFSGYIPGNGTYRIYTANIDGSNLTQLTNTGPGTGYWGDDMPTYGVVTTTIVPFDAPPHDTTPPTLGTITWTLNPKTTSQSTTLSVPATDDASGVVGGEYFIGDTDPGTGNGASMNWNGTALTVNFGANFAPGVYKINVRAQDGSGNWSQTATDYLVVYDPTTSLGVIGKSRDLVPSLAAGDSLPGLVASGQADSAIYGFTVDYRNGALDSHNDFQFSYKTGSRCNKNPANCTSFELNATSFAWQVIDQTNNSRGRFQGMASLVINGVTTTNPFTVEAIDGQRLNPSSDDYFVLKVYAPGANPNVAQPIYQASGYLTKAGAVTVR